jgi:ethanolamine utilization protein EutQ (cupin superfamily)
MTTVQDENRKLQTLEVNLSLATGRVELAREQAQTIREEIARVQGRIEILGELEREQIEKLMKEAKETETEKEEPGEAVDG